MTARADPQIADPNEARAGAALSVEGLRASYRGAECLHGLDFSVAPAEFVTLLGPSGCGKSTSLRCVAGLHRIDGGRIRLNGRTVAAAGLHVRPEHRRINMVFQSYAVWPHMTVFENVAFGLRKSVRGGLLQERVGGLLDLVGLTEFADRLATGLSGGQQQRVALARALATDPTVLLLDEPLSSLDTVLRTRMRAEILRIQRETGKATLYVTHDCGEALAMSDRVIVMQDGRIAQSGTPVALYDRPDSRFVAAFLGPANFLRGTVAETRGREARVVLTGLPQACDLVVRTVPGRMLEVGAVVDLVVRPEHVRLAREDEGGIAVDLTESQFEGARVKATARAGDTTVRFDLERGAIGPGDGPSCRIVIDDARISWVPVSDDA